MTTRVIFILAILCTATVFGDSARENKGPSTMDAETERLVYPEISYARAVAKGRGGPAEPRQRAQEAVERWDNGTLDPEPILLEAWLQEGRRDEYSGRMMYGLMGKVSAEAPAVLNLFVVDEDRDLLGVRIREKYVLPNGIESSYEEIYPAYVGGVDKIAFLGAVCMPAHFRSGNRVKDEQRWQVYVDQAGRDSDSGKIPKPPLWITAPDPNAVEVLISVYDRQGHESSPIAVELRSGEPKTSTGFSERQALKLYEEHGADVARWPDEPITPRPDNAALLYYRAALSLPTVDPCTVRIMDLMWSEREPDDRVRRYLADCVEATKLAQLASQIPECDWGLIRDPLWEHAPGRARPFRELSRMLVASARTLAVDGHYRAALENGLTVRRLAGHIGDDTYLLYCISRDVDYRAMRGILDVLAKMPSEPGLLAWLRDQLLAVKGVPHRPEVSLAKWRDRELLEWRRHNGDRSFDRTWALDQLTEQESKKLADLTDAQLLVYFLSRQRIRLDSQYGLAVPDELLAKARNQYDRFMGSAVRIIESTAAYEKKRIRLEELTQTSYESTMHYDPIALLAFPGEGIQFYHQFIVSDAAYLNCALAAIQIRQIADETGQLPEAIPEGLPKDPFTGKDLGYKQTTQGFVLSFDPERLSGIRVREFEFRFDRP